VREGRAIDKCGAMDPASSPGAVRVGFVSFTEIPPEGSHRDYNAWHELDHMPEQLPIPGITFGQRWVATPACRRARAAGTPPLAGAHYFTLYLMTEPLGATLGRFMDLAGELHRAGRFYEHRTALLSGPYEVLGVTVAPRVLVSAAAVPFRPGTGVYVVVEGPGPSGEEALRAAPDLSSLQDVDGVAGVWSFGPASTPTAPFAPPPARVTVCFLDGAVGAVAEAIGRVVHARDGATEVLLAEPFETIVPGHWDWFDNS